MDKREREELALDIARRVRLLCVQEVPPELLDALVPGSRYRQLLYGVGPSCIFVDFEVSSDGKALHIVVSLNYDVVARVRLDAPSAALAELQRST